MPVFTIELWNWTDTAKVTPFTLPASGLAVIDDHVSISGDSRRAPRWAGSVAVTGTLTPSTLSGDVIQGRRVHILKDGALWVDMPLTAISGGWTADGGRDVTVLEFESDEVRLADQEYISGSAWAIPSVTNPADVGKNALTFGAALLADAYYYHDVPTFYTAGAGGNAPLTVANGITILPYRNLLNWFIEVGNIIDCPFGSDLLGRLSYWPDVDRGGFVRRSEIRADIHRHEIAEYYNGARVETSLPDGVSLQYTNQIVTNAYTTWRKRYTHSIPSAAWSSTDLQRISQAIVGRTLTRWRTRTVRVHPRFDLAVGDIIAIEPTTGYRSASSPPLQYVDGTTVGPIEQLTMRADETVIVQRVYSDAERTAWAKQRLRTPEQTWAAAPGNWTDLPTIMV